MIKNYLLITFRSLMKNKLFVFINTLGMAIALACCIVAYYNYEFNATFDNCHQQKSSIYRVNSIREFQNERTEFGIAPLALGEVARENIKDIDEIIRYSQGGGNFRIKDELLDNQLIYVDVALFNVFTFDFVEGGAGNPKDKSALYINETLAKRYFGNEPALGKPVTQLLDSGKTKEFIVAGVFKDQPANSSLYANAYTSYENYLEGSPELKTSGWKYRNTLFVKINDPSRVAAVEQQLGTYADNNNAVHEDFIIRGFNLDPLEGMAVRDSYNKTPATWTKEGSPKAAIIGVSLMAIFVLLIACFNLTNSSIAISSRRLKEIGLRKVMGGMRKQLIIQFIGETAVICFIALIMGMLIAEFLLIPAFNSLWEFMKLSTDYLGDPKFPIFLILILAFTAFLAGGYPAFYISKFQPTEILKGKAKFGGNNFVTYTLLFLQFCISVIGIVCAIAFVDNARFQENFDLGFNKKGVVYTYVGKRSDYETYRNVLAANPDIISIAPSPNNLYSSWYNDPVKHGDKEIEVDILDVGDNYLKTVGLNLIEGRDFTNDSETDRKESVIITEGLARKLNMTEPIGKEIVWMDTTKFYVIGVVADVYNRGLWEQMQPIMFRYAARERDGFIIVNAPVDRIIDVNKDMEAKWKEMFPNRMYNGRYMDEEMVEANQVNNNIVKMFVFLGVVALMLSATGLFTLVSLNIIKKMKEIGVRKVLGASIANITRVINIKFGIVLFLGCIAGGVLGALMSAALMSSIWDYYQDATLITLLVSAAIMVVVCVLSIGFKTYNTAKMNPVSTLRDE